MARRRIARLFYQGVAPEASPLSFVGPAQFVKHAGLLVLGTQSVLSHRVALIRRQQWPVGAWRMRHERRWNAEMVRSV